MSRITHEEMVKQLGKPGQDIIDSLTPEKTHALHMAVGVSGEIGELIENFMDPDGTRENRVEEFGDIEFYHHALMIEFKLDPISTSLTAAVSEDAPEMLFRLTIAGAALLDAIKKWVVYNKACDDAEVINQLCNVRAYLNVLHHLTGISRDEALEANVDKLYEGEKARYKRGVYSDEQAAARQDKE